MNNEVTEILAGVQREIDEVAASPFGDEQFSMGWRMAMELIRDRLIHEAILPNNQGGDEA